MAYESEESYQTWKWEYQETYEALRLVVSQKKPEGITLLEIGAGNGAFVKRIAPALVGKENIVCTEYSRAGVRSLTHFGIACKHEDVRALDAKEFGRKFDVVCMFQVLEHLDNLDTLFKCLDELTRPEATLFIAVPNDKRRELFDREGIVEDVPPTHVGRFSETSFRMLAERYGWKITKLKREPESLISKATSFARHALARSNRWNCLDRLQNRSLRRLAKIIVATACMPTCLPAIARLRSSQLGVSQWLWLEKLGQPKIPNTAADM